MGMVHVRNVGMHVPHRFVFMKMGMWFAGWIGSGMDVVVVFVMDMRMGVRQHLVNVGVLMPLGQMEPDTGGH